jgi:RNA polymerase sigma factor (sigma-70 family)
VHDEEPGLAPGEWAAARKLRYPGGFDDFFRTEHKSLVKALMFAEGVCWDEADDCVASVMVKVLTRWELPESDPMYVRRPRAYVLRVAKSCFRRQRRRAQTVPLADDEQRMTTDEPAWAVVASRQFVAALLMCLSPGQRQVMYLVAEGYTHVEIAEILRKKPNNIRQTVWQAKKQLRPLLGNSHSATDSSEGEEEMS